MKKDTDNFSELVKYFHANIGPRYKSLHEAFEDCKLKNDKDILVMNELYNTITGREFLKSYYRSKKIRNYNKNKKSQGIGS